MRAAPADYDGQLAFMLDALRIWSEHDGLFRTDDGRRRLEEQERLFGDFVAELRGVGGIVAADADNFAGRNRRDQAHRGALPGTRRRQPLLLRPRRAGDFAEFVFFESGVERSGCGRRWIGGNKAAEFHSGLARVAV